MTRTELVQLHAAIETILQWPPAVFDEVVRWLTPPAPKPNGVDRHPPWPEPSTAGSPAEIRHPPRPAPRPTPYAGKTRLARPPTSAKASALNAEQRLVAALQGSPGESISALAEAAGAGRATTRERLQALAARGAVEKDGDGRWRLKGEVDPSTDAKGPLPGPSPALSSN
jgi:IclR helix-turn-helix domain